MIATLLLGLLSVLFAYLARYKSTDWGLKVSFLLIFLFLALRYNFGNDYKFYLHYFININQVEQFDYFHTSGRMEIGWILINRLFQPFGFFIMTAVLALFNCVVYYRFINKYVPVNYYWLAVFLYIFSTGFMLIHSSAMRQSVSIAMFIFSIDYIFKKDIIRYLLCIGIAYLFHGSAIILLSAFILGFLNWRINKITGFIIILVALSLFLFKESLTPFLDQFISAYFEKYKKYEGAAAFGTGIGFLFSCGLFLLIVYYDKYQDSETALVFKLAIISFMFVPLAFYVQLIGRIGMYFAPATIIVYPVIIENIKKPLYKAIFIILLLFFTIYTFFQFFNSEPWKEYFGTYNTIFSANRFY
jgi:hypothetical protein